MSSSFFNFTTFDVQLWPPPRQTRPSVYADHTLSPTSALPLLLVYHAIVSIALQTRNFRNYEGRRDTVWYSICLCHLFVLECFLINFAIIYQKHCSLSDNFALILYTPAATLENLSRLASKPGVQATLILSKTDGSIIRSTGLLAVPSSSPPQDGIVGNGTNPSGTEESTREIRSDGDYASNTDVSTKGSSAEDIARMVFAFVASAKAFAEGMDKSDEVKLLRLRTRKNEIVIVPDPKFLLVVIHDTPLS